MNDLTVILSPIDKMPIYDMRKRLLRLLCTVALVFFGIAPALAEDSPTVIYEWVSGGTGTGTTSFTGSGVENSDGAIKISSNFGKTANYASISATSTSATDKVFKAGDVVSLTAYSQSNSANFVIGIYTTAGTLLTSESFSITSKGSENAVTKELKLPSMSDGSELYVGRVSGSTAYIKQLKVTRSEGTSIVASFAETSKTLIKSDEAQSLTLPKLTVTNNGEVVTSTNTYSSSNTSVATINSDGSNLTIVAGAVGTATITVKATVSSGTQTVGIATATYLITVKEKSKLVVAVSDVTVNVSDQELTQPTITVYDDNDNRLSADKYTLSVTATKSSEVVTWSDGAIKVTGSAGSWNEGSATFTVTATPTEELSASYTAGSDKFTYTVTKGKLTPYFLPMFEQVKIQVAANQNDTTTAPVLYNNVDISDYFDYTYTITTKSSSSKVKTWGKYIIFTAGSSAETVKVKASATPKTDDDGNDYSDVYNAPTDIEFEVTVLAGTDGIVPDVNVSQTSMELHIGESADFPEVTVKNSDEELTEGSGYTATFISFSPNIATADNTSKKITGISEGTAYVHIVVLGDKLQSTTKTIAVKVKDPNTFRAEKGGTYTRNQGLCNEAQTMRVTLGGWMFPNQVKPTINNESLTTDEFGKDGDDWGTTKKAKWILSGYDYFVVGNANKNPRQENGSNAQPGSTKVYESNKDGKSYDEKGSIADPMFNVPCNGAYLVIATKKPGTVTAHIFQKGVFSSGSADSPQYRPQRRVFVVDEAGQLVASSARIGSTTGKPDNAKYTLSDYTWDLSEMPTTVDAVKAHFVGLNSLTMSADGFVNGVYESNLSYDVCKNEVMNNSELKDKTGLGYRGWAVLADAPVSYTFKTKPGKTYYLYNFGSKINLYGFSFAENEQAVEDETIALKQTDNSQTLAASADGHYAKVSLDRTFKGGIWNASVLPFSLTMQQVSDIFGAPYSKGNEDGTQILYYDRVKDGTIYFVRHAYNTLVAGKPFLIKPSKSGDITLNTADCTEFPYVTIENTQPTDWQSGNGYTWASSYNTQTVNTGDYYIGGTTGNLIRRTADAVTANGYRGYLKAQTSEAKQMVLMIDSESNADGDGGSTTGLIRLEMDGDGNFVERPASGKVYSVNGQLVATDASTFSQLPAGVYIVNGKKYVK